jgi:acetylornithine/N-succinyldiaminopimelate aminotransferase
VKQFPKLFAEVRGMGLMLGVKMNVPVLDMVQALREAGLLTSPAEDNVMRIVPPLVINEEHIREALDILNGVCEKWA